MPDILLTTLNAKYAHAAFGLRYLMANLGELQARAAIAEFDINQRPIDVLEAILKHEPKVVGLGVYIWNVEQATKLVADLKRERDLMGSILESMSEGVLLLDARGQVALVNPSLRSTLLLPKEVIGRSLLETLRRADLADLVARARESGEPVAGEIAVEGLKPRRLSVRVNPMRTPPGAMLVVFFDVTEIRRLESLRRDFVANVSHELRTPVASICSATETLMRGALEDPDAAMNFVRSPCGVDSNRRRCASSLPDE